MDGISERYRSPRHWMAGLFYFLIALFSKMIHYPYMDYGKTIELELTRGLFAKISECDLDLVRMFNWSAYRIAGQGRSGKVYLYGFKPARKAVVDGKVKLITLYNFIMNPPEGMEVDHIDGDPLNNARDNLRIVSRKANCLNRGKRSNGVSSKYLGVTFNKEKGKYCVKIKHEGRNLFGGYFSDEKEAALKYNELASKYHGEYARLNVL